MRLTPSASFINVPVEKPRPKPPVITPPDDSYGDDDYAAACSSF
jgi:hypothetical protein